MPTLKAVLDHPLAAGVVRSRTAAWLVNPRARVDEPRLRRAVQGRTILITGASYGLGEATARRLARAGATVLLVARTATALDDVAGKIADGGGAAHAYPADLSDKAEVEALAKLLLHRHGPPDVIIHNAGKSIRRSLEDSAGRFHDFERTIGVNYLGPVQLTLALLPPMRARGHGHLVNISSIGVRIPPGPRWAAYQASKSAFDVFFRSAAAEAAADGVTATSIYMALIHTRMSAPTGIFDNVPGLTADEAAGLVAMAVVDRPPKISPWWADVADVTFTTARRPWERIVARLYRDGRAARKETRPMSERSERIKGRARRVISPTAGTLTILGHAARALAGSGLLGEVRPWMFRRLVHAYRTTGSSAATLVAVAAIHAPDAPAVIDELGTMTYGELDGTGARIAAGIARTYGVGPGRTVAVLCRNHRGFLLATLAVSRLGADLVYLNTDFSATQLGAIFERNRPDLVIADEEFLPRLDGHGVTVLDAWSQAATPGAAILLGAAAGHPAVPDRPGRRDRPAAPSTITILTSGTTGTPKGAPRRFDPLAVIGPTATVLRRTKLRVGDPVLIGPPLYHGFGLVTWALAALLRSPVVLRRGFDPERALADIARHKVAFVAAVPIMLLRVLGLPDATRARYDTRSLHTILSGGAPLRPELAERILAEFGDVLFNGYGSAEIGIAAIATPQDLRAASGTVGVPAIGVPVRVLDRYGRPVPTGGRGTIFVGGRMVIDGYTGGGNKEILGGLMNTGDRGRLDAQGRLYVDGRDDDMIISGGENVYPQEVEDILSRHPAIVDAAVIGIDDEEYGQRLVAYLVAAGAPPDVADLRRYVKDNLARYKVPRDFVFLDELPRNPTGKVLRGRLPTP